MPCSCGNTICRCGIPCYCSEESCKCLDCAIAVSRFCKVCNKALITERRTNEDTCSCFMGESTALIVENQGKTKCRLGNIPMPIGYFVSGKLMVNFMIPIPVLRIPHFIPQQPFCLMPPVPSTEADYNKISFISDERVLKSSNPLEESVFPSTVEMNQFLSKSSGLSNDRDLTDYSSNSEQNTETFRQKIPPPQGLFRSIDCGQTANIVQNTKPVTEDDYSSNSEQNAETFIQKIHPPPGFLQSIDYGHIVNIGQNTKPVTEDHAKIQQATSFYLPSIAINNISYPVGLMDPVWRLPCPAVCIAGNPDSTVNIINPFYVAGPVQASRPMATSENEFNPPAPGPTSEANDMQCFIESKYGNVQAESAIAFQKNEQTLDPDIILDEFSVPSNNATGNEWADLLSSGNFNGMSLSELCGISANCFVPDQSQSSGVISTSASGKNYPLQDYPDISDPANQILDNVYPEPTVEPWQDVNFFSPLPETPAFTSPFTPIANRNVRTSESNSYRRSSFEEKERSQTRNTRPVPTKDKENIPLYVDPCTIQKMEKLLKSTRKLNVSSSARTEYLDANNFF